MVLPFYMVYLTSAQYDFEQESLSQAEYNHQCIIGSPLKCSVQLPSLMYCRCGKVSLVTRTISHARNQRRDALVITEAQTVVKDTKLPLPVTCRAGNETLLCADDTLVTSGTSCVASVSIFKLVFITTEAGVHCKQRQQHRH